MNKVQAIKCNLIIHTAAAGSTVIGAGLAQIPCADSIPISGVQITMIISLGKVFGITIQKTAAKAIILAFAASYAGRSLSQIVIGWIPGVGNIVNGSTAFGLTEAMGWVVASKMDNANTADDIIESIKNDKTDDGFTSAESPKNDDYDDLSETFSFQSTDDIFGAEDLDDIEHVDDSDGIEDIVGASEDIVRPNISNEEILGHIKIDEDNKNE